MHNTRLVDDLTNVIVNTKIVTDIYCLDGVYQLVDSKLVKLEVSDHPVEETKCGDVDVIIDRSVIKRNPNVHSISSNHHICTVERTTYSLRRQSKLVLVIERHKCKPTQIYFETAEDIRGYAISEDFATLLSLLTKY